MHKWIHLPFCWKNKFIHFPFSLSTSATASTKKTITLIFPKFFFTFALPFCSQPNQKGLCAPTCTVLHLRRSVFLWQRWWRWWQNRKRKVFYISFPWHLQLWQKNNNKSNYTSAPFFLEKKYLVSNCCLLDYVCISVDDPLFFIFPQLNAAAVVFYK